VPDGFAQRKRRRATNRKVASHAMVNAFVRTGRGCSCPEARLSTESVARAVLGQLPALLEPCERELSWAAFCGQKQKGEAEAALPLLRRTIT